MGMICILAIQQYSLMNHALANALRSSIPAYEVVTTNANDLESLITEISHLKPAVVLLGESMPLAAKDTLAHLLMCFPELRVVVVSDDTNWLHVFHKKDVLLTRQSDLLDIVYFQ
jgi:DNA-binding NarL/FixJ family response regulator